MIILLPNKQTNNPIQSNTKQPSHNPLGKGYHKAKLLQLIEQNKHLSDNDLNNLNYRKAIEIVHKTLVSAKVEKISVYAKEIARDHSDNEVKSVVYDIDVILGPYMERYQSGIEHKPQDVVVDVECKDIVTVGKSE